MARHLLSAVAIVTAMFATAQAHAQWSTKTQGGLVMARGNTEAETANAKFEITREVERWKHSFGSAFLYGRSADLVTGQRWDASWQTEHKLSDRFFWFGALRYEDDRFSGFDYQGVVSAGAGRDFIETTATKLSGQLGVGYRRLRPEELIRNELGEVIDRVPGIIDDDVVGNGALRFEYAFNETTKVLNTLIVETGARNTLSQNELALQVQMTRLLGLSVGLKVRNNSEPPPGLGKTDTLTTLNLVYEVKD